ncbi:hypothetical protein K7432_015712 [Basidiobolus ranarum]|uniref:Anaphase-promoting complex subunit 5 n=1 Tax=Basidiobolus ranarum TaxID=34480 RepID=A0ABR2VNT7_9FUNG
MTNTFLTSHKIAILILIDEYTRNLSWDTEVNQSLVFFLMSEIQNAGHDKDKKTMLVNFYTQLENMVSQSGDSIRNILVARLEELETPNDLYDFFKDLQKLIRSEDPEVAEEFEELLLERDSVFGVFVRRAQLAFCKLPFDEVSNLYSKFCDYCRRVDDMCNGMDDVHMENEHYSMQAHHTSSENVSRFDAERFVEHQLEQLEDSKVTLSPHELEAHLDQIHHLYPDLSKAYYVRFLNSTRAGEYAEALECLHKFFDYCLTNQDTALYQRALLNLAVLHLRFNHTEEAEKAITETIEIAHENKDEECLSYALSWLYRLRRTRTSGDKNSEMTKIDSLIEKSKQLNLFQIQTMCELSKARHALEVKHDPVECFESLIKSSSLNINNGLQGIAGTTNLMYASAWNVYGSTALSSLYTQLQIVYHERDVVADDAAIGHCKLAYQVGAWEASNQLVERNIHHLLH